YGYAPYGFFKKLGIRGPRPLPFIGTLLGYKEGIHIFDTKCYQKYGKVWGLYDGRQPVLAIMDTSMIKAILVKECYSVFTNRWMYGIMLQHSGNLVKSLQKKAEADEVIEVKEVFGPYSMDVVTSTAFSVDIDSINHPSDPFVANIKRMVKLDFLNPLIVLVVLFPFLGAIFEKMNVSFFPREVLDFFFNFLKKIKADRDKNEHKRRVDFMQLMVDSQISENIKENMSSHKGLTDHEILSQAMIFIFGGYETSSSSLSFLAYNLATHPDIQKALQEEIDETFPEKVRPTYESLMEMEYLDMVLNESSRLYPIGAHLERMAKTSVEINGVTIPKGTTVMVPVYTLHHDPTLWSEPEVFKPERFSKENRDNIDPYAFLPFGAGPRNCIGMRFALLMMKLSIVEILQNFSFVTCKETEIPLVLGTSAFTAPTNPIKVKLSRNARDSGESSFIPRSGTTFLDSPKFNASRKERMKEEMMNVEALSRAELLTLLSILEGELEAQDVVIHALRAQHRDAFIQERYGQYDLSDPFLALQRDSEAAERQHTRTQPHTHLPGHGLGPNPLGVLKLVMSHCKKMQERMMGQLATAESRHRRMIADLEEERRRRAHDSAQGEDVAFMLQTERDKLLQELEVERVTVRRLEKERAQAVSQVEESLSQQQQLSSSLTAELQKASSQALEEAQKVSELHAMLREERNALEMLRGVLEEEKRRAVQMEARSEKELAEFDMEREQITAKVRKEEERNRELERQVEELKKRLSASGGGKEEVKEAMMEVKGSPSKMQVVSTSVQTEPDGKIIMTPKFTSLSKVNGLHTLKDTESPQEWRGPENGGVVENGGGATLHSPLHPHPHPLPQSPSSTASSSLSSSPISSPVLAKRLGSPGFHQSSYQAGINQRFQAARHKFQSQAELEQQHHSSSGPLSPRDLSPTTTSIPPPPENSTAKQLARNTVTQVLSRFTSQQAGVKLAPISSSPFGTDYRNLAASPPGGRSPSSGPLSPGIRSPLTPRSERTYTPPIPPKKPGRSPTPGSPSHSTRASVFPELTGNCGHSSSGQEGAKEADLVLSSSS
ncbi:hypothetical protein LDENG_00191320, partial [Lucifuga dentata]